MKIQLVPLGALNNSGLPCQTIPSGVAVALPEILAAGIVTFGSAATLWPAPS
ncbi:MAG TPA: hypothetical protein VGI47_03745 [Candidatus Binataceae bacterium]